MRPAIHYNQVTGAAYLTGVTSSQRRRARFDRKSGLLQFRPIDITGLRVKLVEIGGKDVRTPCGVKALARRRAKNRVAKQSRKVNR